MIRKALELVGDQKIAGNDQITCAAPDGVVVYNDDGRGKYLHDAQKLLQPVVIAKGVPPCLG